MGLSHPKRFFVIGELARNSLSLKQKFGGDKLIILGLNALEFD